MGNPVLKSTGLTLTDNVEIKDRQAIFDMVHPIGEVYVQYPYTADPMYLYNKNGITSNWRPLKYNGIFFRAEGGNADEFYDHNHEWTPPQTPQLPNITGTVVAGDNAYALTSFANSYGAFYNKTVEPSFGYYMSGGSISTSDSHKNILEFDASQMNKTIFVDGGEVRPQNYTIKLWLREPLRFSKLLTRFLHHLPLKRCKLLPTFLFRNSNLCKEVA